MDDISPEDYELAVLSRVRLDFAGAEVHVKGTENGVKHYVKGRHSRALRQLDVAVYRNGEKHPYIIMDAKRYKRRITVKDIETFIGMVDDVGAEESYLIAPQGFTRAAKRRATAADMQVVNITTDKALTDRWLPVAVEIYPYDWVFHGELAEVKRLLHENAPPDAIMEALEGVVFDEWISCVQYMITKHQEQAIEFLLTVARYHFDDGWRFNAIQQLMDADLFDAHVQQELLKNETDLDTVELLTDWSI